MSPVSMPTFSVLVDVSSSSTDATEPSVITVSLVKISPVSMPTLPVCVPPVFKPVLLIVVVTSVTLVSVPAPPVSSGLTAS